MKMTVVNLIHCNFDISYLISNSLKYVAKCNTQKNLVYSCQKFLSAQILNNLTF